MQGGDFLDRGCERADLGLGEVDAREEVLLSEDGGGVGHGRSAGMVVVG